MDTKNNLLQQQIASLGFTEEFKRFAQVNHYHTLQDMVVLHIDELKQIPGFGYRLITEYVTFLSDNGLEGVVED